MITVWLAELNFPGPRPIDNFGYKLDRDWINLVDAVCMGAFQLKQLRATGEKPVGIRRSVCYLHRDVARGAFAAVVDSGL